MAKNKAQQQARLAAAANKETSQVETNDTVQTEEPVVNEHANTGTIDAAPAAEAPKKSSIVPSKYAGKYKNGGSDELAAFIKTVCGEGDKFEFSAFFSMCRKNGLPEEKVAHYEQQVADKLHGANGRARMTLRNMLASVVRKNGGLVDLAGNKHDINLPKPAVSGAAAAAQTAAAAPAPAGESDPPSTDDTADGTEAGSGSTETDDQTE